MDSGAGHPVVNNNRWLFRLFLVTLLSPTLVHGAGKSGYISYGALSNCSAGGTCCSAGGRCVHSCPADSRCGYSCSADPRCPASRPLPVPRTAIAYVNSSWVVNRGARLQTYTDGSAVTPLLVLGKDGPSLACGFFCRDPCDDVLFSIFLVVTDGNSNIANHSSGFPQVVWSANRNKTVGVGSRLQLTPDGNLILSDSGGFVVWSSGTAGMGVTDMGLTDRGSLELYSNRTRSVVWQSFDHVTDTVLEDQPAAGQTLVANASAINSTEGQFRITVKIDSFYASIDSPARRMKYASEDIKGGILLPRLTNSDSGRDTGRSVDVPNRFLRLESDGHLRLYSWSPDVQLWKYEERPIGQSSVPKCIYPTVCGRYGICSDPDGPQCSCPENSTYFRPADTRKPNHGCLLSDPPSCETQNQNAHIFVTVENVAYFGYYAEPADLPGTDIQKCREVCLNRCSCLAAFFFSNGSASKGDCYLPSEIFSFISNPDSKIVSSAFLKVEKVSQHESGRHSVVLGLVLGGTFALLLLGLLIGGRLLLLRRRAKDELEGFDLPNLPGMPSRFSYAELKCATGNFARLLGEGGFGTVYHGTLADGASVAVKLLVGKRQGMKEFLAEVETIGSVHHMNLVRLVGYCIHKFQRLLVYEYMPNGSLDRWIFLKGGDAGKNASRTVDWPTRRKIILQVAKGLTYLHEECSNRIAHLDIKPENILLDDSFNAKVSDFGLSKLISRDQSQVLTTMRGTPGYLAPEWLTSLITEKVDVYSFGVVVLETVCGRRNLGGVGYHPKPSLTLVDEAKSAAQEDRLQEIVDLKCGGVEFYAEEAIQMLRTALWCLQGDPGMRPPMSSVVKVLEGVMTIGPLPGLDTLQAPRQVRNPPETYSSSSVQSTLPSSTTLSEPR